MSGGTSFIGMSIPGRLPPSGSATAVLILVSVALIIGSPAAATLVLTKESFLPAPPPVAGSGQLAVNTIAIIPTGATTFSRYHTLQMQTDLVNARWNIQVIVNGIPAAQQSASGTAAFVNGYLLSYPTTSDLSFTVAINGTVPASAGTTMTVLQVTELDNGGAPVPGSSITVSAPLMSPPPVNETSPTVPFTTPPVATTAPARSAGFLSAGSLFASGTAAAVYGYARSRR
jgi:hypothetical protein